MITLLPGNITCSKEICIIFLFTIDFTQRPTIDWTIVYGSFFIYDASDPYDVDDPYMFLNTSGQIRVSADGEVIL